MSLEDDIDFLERVPSLGLLGREPLRILAIGAESRFIQDGDILFRERELADAGYVVQEGSFTLRSERWRRAGKPVLVGPGVLLGELALLTEAACSVTATAAEPSAVVRIPRKLFLKVLEGYPEAAQRLRSLIATRATRALDEISSVRPNFDTIQKPE